MKKFFRLATAFFAATMLSVSFTSCSDNDENENHPDPVISSAAKICANLPEMFPYGRPKQLVVPYDIEYLTYDDNGLLTTVRNNSNIISFNYSPGNEYDAKMTAKNIKSNELDWECYIKLNEAGFANHIKSIYYDNGSYVNGFTITASINYNSDGQVSSMQGERNDDEISHIQIIYTYTNGNITKVEETETFIADGERLTDTHYYTYTNITNKSAFMLFDSMYPGIDDSNTIAYFAGILGKAPRHLPASSRFFNYNGTSGSYDYTWTFNNQGLPLNWGSEYYQIVW